MAVVWPSRPGRVGVWLLRPLLFNNGGHPHLRTQAREAVARRETDGPPHARRERDRGERRFETLLGPRVADLLCLFLPQYDRRSDRRAMMERMHSSSSHGNLFGPRSLRVRNSWRGPGVHSNWGVVFLHDAGHPL